MVCRRQLSVEPAPGFPNGSIPFPWSVPHIRLSPGSHSCPHTPEASARLVYECRDRPSPHGPLVSSSPCEQTVVSLCSPHCLCRPVFLHLPTGDRCTLSLPGTANLLREPCFITKTYPLTTYSEVPGIESHDSKACQESRLGLSLPQ